jgi:membrane fusion protein, heavy metal efflux system
MSKYLSNGIPAIFLAGLMLVSCGKKDKSAESKTEEILPDDIVEMRADQVSLAGIDTGSIELRALSTSVSVTGKVIVAPGAYATVCAPLGGFVREVNLIPGSRITKGQVLARIENREYIDLQQDYLEARNKLEFAGEEYRRHTELYKNEVYSEQNLQEVTAEYKNLKAKLNALEQKLVIAGRDPRDLTEDNISGTMDLIAPISGYIAEMNASLGRSVTPTDVLFSIVNSDRLYLELSLFEKDAGKVESGQKVSFSINNERELHDAVVMQTGKSVTADQTWKVFARVTDTCHHVLPGMYVNAEIETSERKAICVPSEAVVSFDDKNYIFIPERQKEEQGMMFTEYRMISVEKGISSGGYIEIILPPLFDIQVTKLVVKGAYNLLAAKKNAGEMAC